MGLQEFNKTNLGSFSNVFSHPAPPTPIGFQKRWPGYSKGAGWGFDPVIGLAGRLDRTTRFGPDPASRSVKPGGARLATMFRGGGALLHGLNLCRSPLWWTSVPSNFWTWKYFGPVITLVWKYTLTTVVYPVAKSLYKRICPFHMGCKVGAPITANLSNFNIVGGTFS